MDIISKGMGNRIVNISFDDYCTVTGKCVTMLHNHELDASDFCVIGIHVPNRLILWKYDLILPFATTVQYSIDAVFSGGTALDFNNKELGNTDRLGITGVSDPTVTDYGNVIDITKYGTGSIANIRVGASFGSGWFRLRRNRTFLQKLTSEYDDNNIVTRFSFIDIT